MSVCLFVCACVYACMCMYACGCACGCVCVPGHSKQSVGRNRTKATTAAIRSHLSELCASSIHGVDEDPAVDARLQPTRSASPAGTVPTEPELFSPLLLAVHRSDPMLYRALVSHPLVRGLGARSQRPAQRSAGVGATTGIALGAKSVGNSSTGSDTERPWTPAAGEEPRADARAPTQQGGVPAPSGATPGKPSRPPSRARSSEFTAACWLDNFTVFLQHAVNTSSPQGVLLAVKLLLHAPADVTGLWDNVLPLLAKLAGVTPPPPPPPAAAAASGDDDDGEIKKQRKGKGKGKGGKGKGKGKIIGKNDCQKRERR